MSLNAFEARIRLEQREMVPRFVIRAQSLLPWRAGAPGHRRWLRLAFMDGPGVASFLEAQLRAVDVLHVSGPAEWFQVVDARAEQAHRALTGFGLLEQSDRAPSDLVRIAGRLAGMAPRDRGEVAVADLDRHRTRHDLLSAEPPCVVARHPGDLLPNAR